MAIPTHCCNCSKELDKSELFHHEQDCKKYKVDPEDSMCLCRDCERERARCNAIAQDADEDQPYYEW